MYRVKSFLDKKSLLVFNYTYIHSYLNYANLAYGITYRTKLKKSIQSTKTPYSYKL